MFDLISAPPLACIWEMLLISAVIFLVTVIVTTAFTAFFFPVLTLGWLLNLYRSLYLIWPPQRPLFSSPSQSTESCASHDDHLYLHPSSILPATIWGVDAGQLSMPGRLAHPTTPSSVPSLSPPPPLLYWQMWFVIANNVPTKEVLFEQHLHLTRGVVPWLHTLCIWDGQGHGQVLAIITIILVIISCHLFLLSPLWGPAPRLWMAASLPLSEFSESVGGMILQ